MSGEKTYSYSHIHGRPADWRKRWRRRLRRAAQRGVLIPTLAGLAALAAIAVAHR